MSIRTLALSACLCLGMAGLPVPGANAQCQPRLVAGPWTSIDGDVRGMTTFQRDGVPTVCVVGNFTHVNGVEAPRAVWWRPVTGEWGPMGALDGGGGGAQFFYAVCRFDDGSGETLFAASNSGVWKWNGAAWSRFGELTRGCNDIAPISIGGVLRLVVGTDRWGDQETVRAWNGTDWSPLGNGDNRVIGSTYRLLNGSELAGQPDLLAVGAVGVLPAANPLTGFGAKWDGVAWSPIADLTAGSQGPTTYRVAMQFFDDGSPIGNTLYVIGPGGGSAGGVWRLSEGALMSVPGVTFGSNLFALAPFEDGTRARARLYVGGTGLYAWDGAAWETIIPGDPNPSMPRDILSLTTFQPSAASRPILLIGGSRAMNLNGRHGMVYLTSCLPCAADFDHSGAIGVQDLLSYLQAWFAHDSAAEFDGVPGVGLDDLFAFLGAWQVDCL